MEFQTLEKVSIEKILEVFNASFSDYFVPFKLTEAQLVAKMKADMVDLNLSVGAFENDILVGFILHGFDVVNNQRIVYNGGTGVIPSKRGAGLTQNMYAFIIPIFKESNIDSAVLEVISNNIPAIKSYEKSGFAHRRELVCFKGECEKLMINKDIQIMELNNLRWDHLQKFWDIIPTWQSSKHVLDKSHTHFTILGAYENDQIIGYCIFNPNNRRIQQIAVDKDFRRKKVASTLLSKLTERFGNTISIINVDKKLGDERGFFTSMGLKNYLEQSEMVLDLNSFQDR